MKTITRMNMIQKTLMFAAAVATLIAMAAIPASAQVFPQGGVSFGVIDVTHQVICVRDICTPLMTMPRKELHIETGDSNVRAYLVAVQYKTGEFTSKTTHTVVQRDYITIPVPANGISPAPAARSITIFKVPEDGNPITDIWVMALAPAGEATHAKVQ